MRATPAVNTCSLEGGTCMRFVRWFSEIGLSDVGLVGGKNASLGEMIRFLAPLGVRVPDGFAITAEGYRHFLRTAGLERPIAELLSGIRRDDVKDLVERSNRIRGLIVGAELPEDLCAEALAAYRDLSARYSTDAADVAVRSSATAEDLPGASFAGQQDTFLNVRGEAAVLDAVRRCFASLFTARALGYREDMGFDHREVALSVGVQKMVRSDLAASGVLFTLEPESGHRGIILLARPETVHSNRKRAALRIYRLTGKGERLVQGLAVGEAIAAGRAHVIQSPAQFDQFQRGEILVTESTDPDWEPIMKMAAGIVTERGGRTSHAAIVARELGIPAVLGSPDAMRRIPSDETVTLSCAEGEQGRIY